MKTKSIKTKKLDKSSKFVPQLTKRAWNSRIDTGRKGVWRIIRIDRYVGTAVGRYYLMRCIFLVDRNKRHIATITCNTRMETGYKSDSRSVQIVRFVRTAVRRFPLMRSCMRVDSLSEYWTCIKTRVSSIEDCNYCLTLSRPKGAPLTSQIVWR